MTDISGYPNTFFRLEVYEKGFFLERHYFVPQSVSMSLIPCLKLCWQSSKWLVFSTLVTFCGQALSVESIHYIVYGPV